MLCTVIVMAAKFTTAVSSATVSTATYLANSSPNRGTGAAISISSVPRSRSPAVRSIAGYTAPVTVINTSTSGINAASENIGAPVNSIACRVVGASSTAVTPSCFNCASRRCALTAFSRDSTKCSAASLVGEPDRYTSSHVRGVSRPRSGSASRLCRANTARCSVESPTRRATSSGGTGYKSHCGGFSPG